MHGIIGLTAAVQCRCDAVARQKCRALRRAALVMETVYQGVHAELERKARQSGIVMQANEVFDTFCFTISWQGLRNCSTNLSAATAQVGGGSDDEAQDNAEEHLQHDGGDVHVQMARVQQALVLAPKACGNANLASKPEAMTSAVEHCATIAFTACAYEPKGVKNGPPAALMGVPHDCITSPSMPLVIKALAEKLSRLLITDTATCILYSVCGVDVCHHVCRSCCRPGHHSSLQSAHRAELCQGSCRSTSAEAAAARSVWLRCNAARLRHSQAKQPRPGRRRQGVPAT